MDLLRLSFQHDVRRRAGELAQSSWYDRVLDGDTCVLKPDGTPLLVLLRGALSGALYQETYTAVAPLARSSPRHNRGIAAGKILAQDESEAFKGGASATGRLGYKSATRYKPIKQDGTMSKTVYGKDTPSFIAGFSERSARFPYCRQTAYTNQHQEDLRQLLPSLNWLSLLLRQYVPHRYDAQARQVARTSPDFVIPGTVFTTLTINRNWQTALHTDKGDLAAGFGVMACLRSGQYSGGLYVMPGFGIAVDLQAGDVILSDVHEWHGNTPLVGDQARYERITMVCYYRERMIHCGTAQEELARVKRAGREGMRGTKRTPL